MTSPQLKGTQICVYLFLFNYELDAFVPRDISTAVVKLGPKKINIKNFINVNRSQTDDTSGRQYIHVKEMRHKSCI